MEKAVFSVSGLNQHIKELLDNDVLLSGISVRGELSNYKIYPSGHHYFTLKDSQSTVRCVMFKSAAVRLRFRPENGLSVICSGSVSVYPRDGAYQLYVQSIMPEGVGDLHLAFEQLKTKLNSEGLFDPSCKKAIPRYPKTIAVITSDAGAAVRDIIRILGERWPLSKVIVLPVKVQGTDAADDICSAIYLANALNIADLIITGRGGGSIEDLWSFNEEKVARAIFASSIPVISAVGHEPDVTIADYVADLRASTPSNGAELAVPDKRDILSLLDSYKKRLAVSIQKQIDSKRHYLNNISGRAVFNRPFELFEQKSLDIAYLTERLISAEKYLLQGKESNLNGLGASLDSLSPLKVLQRGYGIVRTNEKVIRSIGDIAVGDGIDVYLKDGVMHCRVNETEIKTLISED